MNRDLVNHFGNPPDEKEKARSFLFIELIFKFICISPQTITALKNAQTFECWGFFLCLASHVF